MPSDPVREYPKAGGAGNGDVATASRHLPPTDSVAGPESLAPTAGLVDRPRLIRKLEEATAPVVLLNAPSGYGKSVLLGQWAEHDPRPFASIMLGDEHNDPVALLGAIVAALEEVEPVPAEVSAALCLPEPDIEGAALPRLTRALAARKVRLVLVLDDLENVESPQSLQAVSEVGSHLARGSQLALATRTVPDLPVGRLRAHHGLSEFGRRDLAMNKTECESLLAGLGVELGQKELDTLVRHTEGWPAALYLACLAFGEDNDPATAIAQFAGDDRIVVDYLREEFLAGVSRRRLEFLRGVSILDRLSGSLCDAVLDRTGSARVLRDLSRSNMLLTPLDRRDDWFRFHALLVEMLRSELHRVEPDKEAALHGRASAWWAEHGDSDRAIHHAIEGGAVARAGELLWAGVPAYMTRGRNATVMRWLDRLGEEKVATDPGLSLTAAYARITRGAGSEAEYWAAVARSLLPAVADAAKRLALTSGLVMVDAALARQGVEQMSADAAAGAELLPDESPWMSMCCLLDGVGLHLRGHREEAYVRLREGARRGAVGAPSIQVLCLAQLSLLAIEEGDWQVAEMLAYQARAQIDRSGLGDYGMMATGIAVSAFVCSHFGKVEKAVADMRHAARLLGQLDDFAPWYEAETRIVLARTAVRLDDPRAARAWLDEARTLLRQTPDATVLSDWIRDTAASVEAVSASGGTDLTPAELRVLHFLPTRLSLPEIAAQIFVSPNTVKTQAQAVYRKLGVRSRRQAVEHARRAGLVDGNGAGPDPADL